MCPDRDAIYATEISVCSRSAKVSEAFRFTFSSRAPTDCSARMLLTARKPISISVKALRKPPFASASCSSHSATWFTRKEDRRIGSRETPKAISASRTS